MTELGKKKKWSYSSSERIGWGARVAELWDLYQASKDPEPAVNRYISLYNSLRTDIRKRTEQELVSCSALEIGPGQKLGLMRCLSKNNHPTGIDMDIIPQGLSISDYARMLQYNSMLRVAKTVGRKVLGLDAAFEHELAQQMGVRSFPTLPMHRMDATQMSFADGHFDLAYSFSVFEHIDKPEAALREIARVLKPNGVAYISIHIFTSHSGCHVSEMMSSNLPQEPYWPYLRPVHREGLQPTAYLNEVSLSSWMEMFDRVMPGAWLIREQQKSLVKPLAQLRAKNELTDYTDEELLTVNFIVLWQKDNEEPKGEAEIRWVP
ncbi:MAG: class I SAM-dependent methyltransferase [Proteobacteria bacterium]|nr:class I SAM-dependent methyltransferase [Pseudomonadota bacterium]